MSEIKFFHPIEVRYGDLDPQGHLNNSKYLTYFEQARIRYFVELGLFVPGQSFMDIGVIMAESKVTYHAPVEYGTPVKAGACTCRLGNKSMTVNQAIVHAETGEVFASGYVVLVACDYREQRTVPIPEKMRKTLAEYEGLES
jgi:acyl-CoA thioester hydrolase